MEELGDQDESGGAIVELTARVQELEQQVAELKAELH
jgi:polyhydroxyalkanoate synthesis regulator phasin